jgi:malonate transporter and related proteins
MDAILITVLPVFGMIVLGYGLAIPAFLFRTVSTMPPQEGAPWNLWLAFFGGLGITWMTTAVLSRFIDSLDYSGGAAASMATGFGNLALLGTPLALSHFGQGIGVPLGMILSIHAPILWTAATLHREISRHSGNFSLLNTARELGWMLATNAIIIALLAGAMWRYTGLGLHAVPDRMLAMLSDASIPTALIALGVSLAAYSLKGSWGGMFTLIGLKMVLMPCLVFVIARFVVTLPPLWIEVAVLLAAMPTGANAFLFSQRNNEAVPAVSGAIALGTGLAAITASILLWLMDAGVL